MEVELKDGITLQTGVGDGSNHPEIRGGQRTGHCVQWVKLGDTWYRWDGGSAKPLLDVLRCASEFTSTEILELLDELAPFDGGMTVREKNFLAAARSAPLKPELKSNRQMKELLGVQTATRVRSYWENDKVILCLVNDPLAYLGVFKGTGNRVYGETGAFADALDKFLLY